MYKTLVSFLISILLLSCNDVVKDLDITNIKEQENNIVEEQEIMDTITINVNGNELKVKLEDNSSVDALLKKLEEGDITIKAEDYGNFEKVGSLGFSLPQNDKKITTKPGDLILYQGNQITLYYDTNTWSFTKLGEVTNVDEKELKDILGSGDVTMVIGK